MVEEQKWPSRKREGVKFKLFRMVQPEMGTEPASSQPCCIPFSGHNPRGPQRRHRATGGVGHRSGDGHGRHRPAARTDKGGWADTHRLSLGALFAFEASNTRLTLDKRDSKVPTLGRLLRPCPHLQGPRQRTPV